MRTSKWLGLVLGFMLRVRVRVSIRVKIKVRVSSSILPYGQSAGLVRRSAFYPWPRSLTIAFTLTLTLLTVPLQPPASRPILQA